MARDEAVIREEERRVGPTLAEPNVEEEAMLADDDDDDDVAESRRSLCNEDGWAGPWDATWLRKGPEGGKAPRRTEEEMFTPKELVEGARERLVISSYCDID